MVQGLREESGESFEEMISVMVTLQVGMIIHYV